MPVLITGAHTSLGLRTTLAVLASGGEVRAYLGGPGDVQTLRQAGAIVAQGDPFDEGHLETAMEQVHTVVHLGMHAGGGLLSEDADALVEEAATVVTAAIGAGVRRLIGLSITGADPDADDPLRRAKAVVEDLLADAPLPTIALRASLVDTPAARDAIAAARLTGATLDTEVAPVQPVDLVAAIALLDDLRGTSTDGHAVLTACGPEVMTVRAYLHRVGAAPGAADRLLGRVFRGSEATPLLLPALAGPWLDPDWPDVFATLSPTPPQPVPSA